MAIRFLPREQFVKGADIGDLGSVGLTKGGLLDGPCVSTKDALHAMLTKDGLTGDAVTRAVDEMSDGEVAFSFVLSTADADRQGDVIKTDGWQLDNYRKNPVVLWAHDYEELPIGRASAVYVSGGKLKAVDRFSTDHELAITCAKLYQKGFLSAVSVGFRPVKWSWNEDRGAFAADFDECELLEHSAVPVPMHQDALIEARSAGIDIAPAMRWAEKLLDTSGGLWLPKSVVESAISRAKGSKITVDLGDRKSARVVDGVDLALALEAVKAAGLYVISPDALATVAKNAPEPAPVAAPEPAPVAAPEPAPVAAPAAPEAPAAPAPEIKPEAEAEMPADPVPAPAPELSLEEIKAATREAAAGLFAPLRDRFAKFHTDQTGRLD